MCHSTGKTYTGGSMDYNERQELGILKELRGRRTPTLAIF